MGLRGPGAKPTKATPTTKRRRAPAWKRKGLSRADRVIAFCQSMKITSGKGAGRKLKLRPWQRKIIHRLYRTKAGRRIVRTGLVTMARKNGKTQLAATLALCHLVGPEAEARGEVYSAASDRNQAARVYREMEFMIHARTLTSRHPTG